VHWACSIMKSHGMPSGVRKTTLLDGIPGVVVSIV
jgi:hypothetical protein